MTHFKTFILWTLLLHLKITSAQNNCGEKNSCSECIQASPECVWCAAPKFPDKKRCNVEASFKGGNSCANLIQVNNENKVVENRSFSPTPGAIIQLRPQRYQIKIKPNKPERISIMYKRAEDYPMDLYYLVDLSNTMKPFKNRLAEVGNKLAEEMEKTTKKFQIGFGSFVDKPVMPYSPYDLTPKDSKIEAPYSFHNRVPLTQDSDKFVSSVKDSLISSNTDAPEGTLDALMQVVVCKKEIGWRDKANKIIVVATDEDFHIGGDGKLGGILIPNDGECHMDNRGKYTHGEVLDYPTMNHIAEKIRHEKMNVVFAVDNKVKHIYDDLVEIIGRGNAITANLVSEEKDIINLIKKVYNNSKSEVTMRSEPTPDYIKVNLYSECNSNKREKTSTCSGLQKTDLEKGVKFVAEINLSECPKDKSLWNQRIKIGLTNFNESIDVELEMLCECDCEKESQAEENSRKCSQHGTFACGKCFCTGGTYGDDCRCNPSERTNLQDREAGCRDEKQSRLCSDHGKCECGQCQCEKKFSGKHCECDNSPCYKNDKECNNNGECKCGTCECNDDYQGVHCDCLKSNATCIDPISNKVCSDNGSCVCGKCECKVQNDGKYCQKCTSVNDCPLCDEIKSCVQKICDVVGHSNCTQCKITNTTTYVPNQEFESLIPNNTEVGKCDVFDKDNCIVTINYFAIQREGYDDAPLITVTYKKGSCPLNLVATVSISFIAGIIIIGVATLLLWKLITEILDRNEFAKFKKELDAANWDQSANPLYKPTTTTFKNPTFTNN